MFAIWNFLYRSWTLCFKHFCLVILSVSIFRCQFPEYKMQPGHYYKLFPVLMLLLMYAFEYLFRIFPVVEILHDNHMCVQRLAVIFLYIQWFYIYWDASLRLKYLLFREALLGPGMVLRYIIFTYLSLGMVSCFISVSLYSFGESVPRC